MERRIAARILRIVLCLFLSAPVMAQITEGEDPDTQARELYENGLYQFENGQYEQAITAWEAAYELSGRHRLVYNIASAQERLGLWQEALDSLTLYRTYAPRDEWTSLERRIVNLERRIAAASEATTAVVVPQENEPNTRSARIENLPAFGLVTGGAALASTGLILGLSARSAGLEAAMSCVNTATGVLCSSSVGHLVQRQQRLALGSDITTTLGLLSATGGVLLYLRDGEDGEDDDASRVGLSLRPMGTGLVLMGDF